MSTFHDFVLETDEIDLVTTVLQAIVPVAMKYHSSKDKDSSGRLKLYIRDDEPSHTFHDGSDYTFAQKSMFGDSPCLVLKPEGMFHGAIYLREIGRHPDRVAAAAEICKDGHQKTRPTKLWVCSAGCWYDDAGKSPVKPRSYQDMVVKIVARLLKAKQERAREADQQLLYDEHCDGSELGYRIEAYEYAFTTIHASLVRIYYSK